MAVAATLPSSFAFNPNRDVTPHILVPLSSPDLEPPLVAAPKAGGRSVFTIPNPDARPTYTSFVRSCISDYMTCRLVYKCFRAIVADLPLMQRHLGTIARIDLDKPDRLLLSKYLQSSSHSPLSTVTQLVVEVWRIDALRSLRHLDNLNVLTIVFSADMDREDVELNNWLISEVAQATSACGTLKRLSLLDFPVEIHDICQIETWIAALQRPESIQLRIWNLDANKNSLSRSHLTNLAIHFRDFWLAPLSRH